MSEAITDRRVATPVTWASLLRAEAPASAMLESALFWISGLALVLGGLAYVIFPWRGEAFESTEHVFLGAMVPLLAWGIAERHVPERLARPLRRVFVALFVLLLAVAWAIFCVKSGKFAVVSLVAVLVVREWSRRIGAPPGRVFLASAFGFLAGSRLPWWKSGWTHWSLHGVVFTAELLGFTLLGLAAVLPRPDSERTDEPIRAGWWDAIPLVVFALASARVPGELGDQNYFIGAVEMLRQGGRLLWDTPSQYGFLNIWLASLIPAGSAWQSIYILNSVLIFASSVIFYVWARRFTRGWAGVVFSGLLTWATVLMVPGWAETLEGPNRFPSAGALRFVWCFVLLAWGAILAKRSSKPGHAMGWKDAVPVAAIWCVGCLWSGENLAYASAGAWPILFMIALEAWKSRRYRDVALVVSLPFLFFALTVGAVEAFYRLKLGHGPDWRCLFDFALAFQGGMGGVPIDLGGAVAALVWAGLILVSSAAVAFRFARNALWVIVPGFGIYWATASYFVCRSVDPSILTLAPIWLGAVMLALVFVKDGQPGARTLRSAALPLMVGVLVVAFGSQSAVSSYLRSMIATRSVSDVDSHVRAADDEALALFRSAGLGEKDRLAFFGRALFVLPEAPGQATPVFPRFWLPLAPAPHLSVLPPARQSLYASRLLERLSREQEGAFDGGWTLEPKIPGFAPGGPKLLSVQGDWIVNPYASGLYAGVLRGYSVDRTLESAHWRLLHWRRVANRVGSR